jgi:ferredoxin
MDQVAAGSREKLTNFVRGIGLRQIRLACGLVLFAYLISHFLNHALGNISLQAMADGVYYHTLFWQYPPVAIIFYASALVHSGLGFWALYQRRQFSWKAIEPLQLVLGLSIPALVAAHVVGARLGQSLFGQEKLYPQELYSFWVAQPSRIWLMSAVVTIAWVHGCIGLHFWLRMRAFENRAAPYLLAAAVLVPTLALLGFYQSGRSVTALSHDSVWRENNLSPRNVGTPAQQTTLERITDDFLIGYLGLIGFVLLARGARVLFERRVGTVTLSYGNGRTVRVRKGLSVLEASLRNNVPHASVCGGRARCSTCLIRVIGDCSGLPGAPRSAKACARPGRDLRSVDPAGLPVATERRSHLLPAVHAEHGLGQRPRLASEPDRRGALSRQPVRRYARLDPVGRTAAAVRHRLYRQPVSLGGVAGGDRMRRHAQPIRRRRHAGAVRARRRPRGPPAARLEGGATIAANIEELNQFWSTICASRSVSASAFTPAKSSSATSAIAITWCSPRLAMRSMSRQGCRT